MTNAVVEFRQYTLRGGRRDELIRLFEAELKQPQEAVGAHVLATFRDLDDPDRFVWMRGFADMAARKAALEAFYDGPVWKAHRQAANATIVDSDNVLLLHPAAPDGDLLVGDQAAGGHDVVRATVHYLGAADPSAFGRFFAGELAPRIEAQGATLLGAYVTETAANTFRHPVREGENVFLWLAGFGDEAAERSFTTDQSRLSGWRDDAPEALLAAFMRKPEVSRLSPMAHSPLPGRRGLRIG